MNRERFHEVQERIEQVINVLGQHDVTATILETLATKDHASPMKMHVSIGAGVTLTCQHPGGGEGAPAQLSAAPQGAVQPLLVALLLDRVSVYVQHDAD